MMRISSFVLALALVAGSASAAEWEVYRNARFGTTVDVPADVFRPLPAPDNGDGQRFESADGRASLTVFAGNNVERRTLRQLIQAAESDATGERITYRKAGRSWFVISGFRGDDVFYRKLLLSEGGRVGHTVELVYPAAEKATYDRLTARIANSLSVGD